MARDEHGGSVGLVLASRLNIRTSRGDAILAVSLRQAPHELNKPLERTARIQPITILRASPLPKQPADCTTFEFEM